MPLTDAVKRPVILYAPDISSLIESVLALPQRPSYLFSLPAGYVIHDRTYFEELTPLIPAGGNWLLANDIVVDGEIPIGAALWNLREVERAPSQAVNHQQGSLRVNVSRTVAAYRSYFAPKDADRLEGPFLAHLRTLARESDVWRDCIFLFNTERIRPSEWAIPEATCIIGLPSGFKTQLLTSKVGGVKALHVHYDFSTRPLEHRREMLETWNGRDFMSFNREFQQRTAPTSPWFTFPGEQTPERAELLWREVTEAFGGESAFAEFWQEYRSSSHRFIHVDIIEDPELLIAQVPAEGQVLIWISNIFQSAWTASKYTFPEILDRYVAFLESLAARNPLVHVAGKDIFDADAEGSSVMQKLERARQLLSTLPAPDQAVSLARSTIPTANCHRPLG